MKNDTHKLLTTAKELRGLLKTIENLLDGYSGIEGNHNYVKYCLKKATQANEDDVVLEQLYEDVYNADIEKRKGINIFTVIKIIEKYFKLLDDIDTAGDMFKPTWCRFTSAVEQIHRLRWLFTFVETANKDENDLMNINGNCFRKENRVALIF